MRTALAPVVALLVLLALAPAAAASPGCPAQLLSRPFAPWLDYAWYEAAPDGGLEAGGGNWTLAGAAVVDGGQPWGGGARSLALAAGGSATTAPACITPAHPTMRFFARGTGLLTVSVLFAGGVELPIGVVAVGSAWAPSPILPVAVNLLGDQHVRFRFAGTGTFRIDDVYVDPYSKG